MNALQQKLHSCYSFTNEPSVAKVRLYRLHLYRLTFLFVVVSSLTIVYVQTPTDGADVLPVNDIVKGVTRCIDQCYKIFRQSPLSYGMDHVPTPALVRRPCVLWRHGIRQREISLNGRYCFLMLK